MTKSKNFNPINNTSKQSQGEEASELIHIPRSSPWFPRSLSAIKGEIRHTVRFCEAERMVFVRWMNRYQPTKNYQDLFSNPWCPLFGVMPFENLSDHPFLKTAIALIKHARRFWGIPLHISVLCPEAYPDPRHINKLTGYPKEKIRIARRLFESEDHQKELWQRISASERTTLLAIQYVWEILRKFYESDSFKGNDEIFEHSLRSVGESLMSAYEDCLNERSLLGYEKASVAVQHKEWRNERIKEMYDGLADKFNHHPYSIAREIETRIKMENGTFQRSFEKRFGQKHEKKGNGLYDIQIIFQRQIRRIIEDKILKEK